MKNFWKDIFYDIDEGNSTREDAIGSVGCTIAGDLIDAEKAIQDLEPKKAIEIIREIRKYI